jgi:hypothetical protein
MPQITIAGKSYHAEVIDGEAIIEGMTAGEFVDLLVRRGDTDAIEDMSRLFFGAVRGEIPMDGHSLQMAVDMMHADREKRN